MDMHGELNTQPQRRGPSAGAVVLLAIIFGVVAGFGGTLLALWAQQQGYVTLPIATSTEVTVPAQTAPTGNTTTSSPQKTFASVAAQMNESVVNINTRTRNEDPIASFFGGGSQYVDGLGTGIIVDPRGYILTNYHVVGGAGKITVTVMHAKGKQQYNAEFVGGDQQEDLAVVKINARDLKAVRFGDSKRLLPGDWVMAIGNPFGFEHTVSVGVVSALNRSLPVDNAVTMRGMIQTDASINPGNSGGPLVNQAGEVVGINSAIFVGQGGGQPQANGIGFSIPSNRAKEVMDQLIDGKKVQHPYIGISFTLITDDVRRQERLPVKHGVLVTNIYAKGPAAKAGLKPNDIIESVGNAPLREENSMSDYINKRKVGDTVELKIKRWDDGKADWVKKTIRVKLADKPASFQQEMTPTEQPQEDPNLKTQPRERGFGFPIVP